MTPEDERELEILRARAYGPRADILEDESAQRRLAELERRTRPVQSSQFDDPETLRVLDAATASNPASVDGSVEDAEEPSTRPSPRWTLSRAAAYAWGGSLVLAVTVTAVVASLITAALSPAAPAIAGTTHVASMSIDPDFSWASMFPEQDARGYDHFFGLTIVAVDYTDDGDCLSMYVTENIDLRSNSYSGPGFAVCGAGAFPPAAVVAIDDSLPLALRQEFGEGAALQFVLSGHVVEVYSDSR